MQWECGRKHGYMRDDAEVEILVFVSVLFFLLRCFSSLDDETGKKFVSIKMVNKDL